MRALRPGALPTDTAIRFLLVLAAVTSATLYLFQSLWFVARGELFADAVRRCSGVGATAEALSGLIGTASAQLQEQARCQAPVSREQAAVELGGCLLVLVVAWLVYRGWPRIRERRAHLTPPDPVDAAVLVAEVGSLADSAAVDPVPALRLEPANPMVAGYAYGAGSDLRLGVTGGLVVSQVLDPPGFRAVIRHELGHVANRDVPWTYYAMAVWWAFLALAVTPVVVLFAFRDLNYLLRLGWRTAVLAALVALTIAALLRVRESYADARAAEWGSAEALDAQLAASPPGKSRRPAQLRTHPTTNERRRLLADPDGLFASSGWAVFAAGVAGSTALASLVDLTYLVSSRWAVVLACVLVAPLLSAVVCTSAWRVGLREAVRGQRLPAVGPIGLGLGLGLAVGPVLSFDAAAGGVATGLTGWLGHVTWALVMLGGTMLVVRWAVDCARLRVAAALGEPGGPRRALVVHTIVMTGVFAVWLAMSVQALNVLTLAGPVGLLYFPIWSHLPEFALGAGGASWTLIVVGALLIQPVRARQLAGRPWASWFWREPDTDPEVDIEDDPEPGLLPEPVAETPAHPTRLRVAVLTVGGVAGLVGGLAGLGALLISVVLSDDVRASDAFVVELVEIVGTGVIAAAVCAGAVAAMVVPARWWPLGLLAAGVALVVAGVLAWLTLSAYRMGFLAVGDVAGRPLAWSGTRLFILEPALRSLLPTVLAMAVVGSVRLMRAPRPAPTPDPEPARSTWIPALGALGAGAAVAVWLAVPTLLVLGATVPTVTQAAYTVTVPTTWTASADESTGMTQFVTVAQDLVVSVGPAPFTGTEPLGEAILVGGRQASLIDQSDEGGVRWLTYELGEGENTYWVRIAGTPEAIDGRQDELRQLLDAVHWRSDTLSSE